MQLFSADATMFFLPTKVENSPSKYAQKYSNVFSPWAAKTAKKEEFMSQNVAYRPTVYKIGARGSLISQ